MQLSLKQIKPTFLDGKSPTLILEARSGDGLKKNLCFLGISLNLRFISVMIYMALFCLIERIINSNQKN